jgi:hypothetical protein
MKRMLMFIYLQFFNNHVVPLDVDDFYVHAPTGFDPKIPFS